MHFTASTINRLTHLRSNKNFIINLIEKSKGNIILFKKSKYNGILIDESKNSIHYIKQSGEWDLILKQWSNNNLNLNLNIIWLGITPSKNLINSPTNEILYGDPIYAIDISNELNLEPLNKNLKWFTSYNEIVNLSNEDATIFSYANIFIDYFQKHKFCANCGSKLIQIDAGSTLKCLNNSPNGIICDIKNGNNLNHPRIDPVVIIALYNSNGEVLLGHNKNYRLNKYMFTCFSGFMEPGESFEQSCQREVYEETGINLPIEDIKIINSQPWPFPANLMVGCIGFIKDLNVKFRTDLDNELDKIEWFNHDDILKGEGNLDGIDWIIPPITSIAGNLIRDCAKHLNESKSTKL